MNYCKKCVYPSIAVNLHMSEDGICSSCKTFEKAELISHESWEDRKKRLINVFDEKLSSNSSNYDCLIPVSGGKDSTWQVYNCLKYGLTPLAVTYKSPGRNNFGEKNLQSIKNHKLQKK